MDANPTNLVTARVASKSVDAFLDDDRDHDQGGYGSAHHQPQSELKSRPPNRMADR